MKRKVTVRSPKLFVLLGIVLFFFIFAKLSYISLSNKVDNIDLKEFANNRNTKEDIIYAKRGNIYDKDGNNLASTVNSYKLIAYLDERRTTNPKKPQHVIDKEETAKALSEILPNLTYEFALERLNKDGQYQVEFGKGGADISESVKNKIDALNLPGIDFIEGIKRTYSIGSFASYIIGYAKINEEGEIKGELGIESYFNTDLSGVNGKRTYQTDAYGYTLPSAEVIEEAATDGANIYLTIDSNVQWFAEDVTKNLTDNYEMDWMIFTVMDANTGAIIASATSPNFNPNDLSTIKSYINPLVSYEYEPGSTMKIFSFASSIEEGKYDGSKTYKSGTIQVADATIKDHNKIGWGNISYDTGFAYSSNVAAASLGLDLGRDKLIEYYKNLGFGDKTGIELANEVKGKVDFKYQTEVATASFGQGITVTPIQMLQALSALTNDGTIIKPYIVEKITDSSDNIIYDGGREEVRKVYSKETMDQMKKLMHNVVYDGLNTYWQPSKTIMFGKTGTAQIAGPSGGYLTGDRNFIRSFAGVFPEEDPKYIVYTAVKQMNTSSARPIAAELTKAVDKMVSHLGVEIENENNQKKIIELKNYISKKTDTSKKELLDSKVSLYTLGTGEYITNQYPSKGFKIVEGSKVFLITNKKDYIMEDLTGWSLSEVSTYANLVGIKLNTEGYGYVISQSIPAGTLITDEMELTINLSK